MSDIIKIDTRGIMKWAKTMQTGPKVYGRAAAVLVNDLAFELKDNEIIKHMQRRTPMIVRKPRFAQKQLRVVKARPRSNITFIVSRVGSVATKPRFSGWAEQELGTQTKRTRTMGLKARGNKRKSAVRPSAKLRAGKHPRPADFGLRGASGKLGRAKAALAYTRQTKYRKPWVILGHNRISDGLVKWQGKKLVRLQYFSQRKQAQPERVKWLRGARDIYMRGLGNAGLLHKWNKAIKRVSEWK